MSTYASPLSNGKTSPSGFLRVFGKIFTGSGVIESTALTVSAQLTPDMTVQVSGSALDDNAVLIHTDGTFIQAWNESAEPVTITANASGVTKTDAIVAYVDIAGGVSGVSDPANNPGALKFVAVRRSGTSTGAPISAEIATEVSNNPSIVLAYVTVSSGATSINSGNITNQRTFAQMAKELLEPIGSDQLEENFLRGRRRNHTTNSTVTDYLNQFGWTYMEGNGTATLTGSVAFPTAFSSAPILIANILGNINSTPSSISSFTSVIPQVSGLPIVQVHSISTTGFSFQMTRSSGSFSAGNFYGMSWDAKGAVS